MLKERSSWGSEWFPRVHRGTTPKDSRGTRREDDSFEGEQCRIIRGLPDIYIQGARKMGAPSRDADDGTPDGSVR